MFDDIKKAIDFIVNMIKEATAMLKTFVAGFKKEGSFEIPEGE